MRSSMRFDEPNDDVDNSDEAQEFEVISKTNSDLYLHVNGDNNGYDETDYPENPFGDREGTTNPSLFFDDGNRSVDYVLVWKKILPPDNIDETDALKARELDKITKEEESRAARRVVFEENLQIEGLQLEKYVVDDEIHFVKIHAPLEVLRRYAEILKLRMPMKEVNIKNLRPKVKLCSHSRKKNYSNRMPQNIFRLHSQKN